VAKKKKDDAAADFFGDDDMDWFDDDESEEGADEVSQETLPVAPPPPPPFQPTPGPTPLDQQGWADRVSAAPSDGPALSSAPTLVFSSVPTLPPQIAPDLDGPAPPADPPTEDEDEPTSVEPKPPEVPAKPSEDVATEEATPEEVAAAVEAAGPEATPEPEPEPEEVPAEAPSDAGEPEEPLTEEAAFPETEEVYGDDFDGQTAEATPLVKTREPDEVRFVPPPVRVGMGPAQEDSTFSSPPERPTLERWTPLADDEAWRQVATAMLAEAAVADGDDKLGLLYEAASIYYNRINDIEGASTMLADAQAAGCAEPKLHRALTDIALVTGRFEDALTHLVQSAEAHEGSVAAELFLEAAGVAMSRLDQADTAAELAQRSLQAEPTDFAALSMLRDMAGRAKDAGDRFEILRKLADASEGYVSADTLVELAAALEESDADGAVQALQEALQASPIHGAAWLQLERLLRGRESYADLARLYLDEANRDGQPDVGWWQLKAARAYRDAGDAAAADTAYDRAVEEGYLFAERERQAAHLGAGALDKLAGSLEAEAAVSTGPGAAFTWYRLALQKEKLGNPAGALEAYKMAVRLDAHAAPAGDAVGRLMKALGHNDDLMGFWQARLETAADDGSRAAMMFRMAEIAEGKDAIEDARSWFEQALETADVSIQAPARDGLARTLYAQGAWGELAQLYRGLAEELEDPEAKADALFAAATVGKYEPVDAAQARDDLMAVLEAVPTHTGALTRLDGVLAGEGAWEVLAGLLQASAEGSGRPERRASLFYRAARLLADCVGDEGRARACVERSVEADPGFLPAVWLLRQISGASDQEAKRVLYLKQAEVADSPEARHWSLFAASQLGDAAEGRRQLQEILDERADHPGALAAMEVACLVAGEMGDLAELYDRSLVGSPTTAGARLTTRVAEIYADLGDTAQANHALKRLMDQEVEGRPLRAASRLAEAVGAWEEAAQLLEGLLSYEDNLHRARIHVRHLRNPGASLPILTGCLASADGDLGAALLASVVARLAQDRQTMVRAHGELAKGASARSLKGAYARWTAGMLAADGREDEALAFWQMDLALRPDSVLAFEGVERGMIYTGNIEGLRVLYADHRPDDLRGLALGLERSEEDEKTVEILRAALSGDGLKLPTLLVLEQALSRLERWQDVYDTVCQRREISKDESQKREIDAKRRWLLSEKLAETDLAWELYQKLHEESPDDREVTEAVARIAGARGETELAIRFLKELAETAADKTEAARYQRRVGDAYEASGDASKARQAYLDALDYVPDDRDALDGLKRLAQSAGDWNGVVQVLQREAGIADPERRVALKREIARVTEDELGDAAVAMDAWRAVLDEAPDDEQALRQLLKLAEGRKEWGVFLETGNTLVGIAPSAEKPSLYRRMGLVCRDQHNRDDAIRYLELAVSGDAPDIDAAIGLEEIYSGRADWTGAVRALRAQGRVATEDSARVDAYLKAARIESVKRHDRQAASVLYGEVLGLQPDQLEAMRFMEGFLFESRRFDEALLICQRLEGQVTQDQDLDDFDTRLDLASFFFRFGQMLSEAGRAEEALSRYEKALEFNSTPSTLGAIAPLYVQAEEWSKAEGVYRRLIQLSGGQGDRQVLASHYTQLGLVERQLDKADKAQKRFTKALELDANHVGALNGLALILEDRQEWSHLLDVYNNIIYHATAPSDVIDAYMTKGRILDDHMTRPDKAGQHYQRSLDFDPRQPHAYIRLAELAMRRDDYQEAGDLVERALALQDLDAVINPIRSLLLLCRAAAKQDAGRTSDAADALSDAQSVASEDLVTALGANPLADLDALRQVIKDSIPRHHGSVA